MAFRPHGITRTISNQSAIALLSANFSITPYMRKRFILRMFFQIMQGFISCDRGKDTWLWRNKVR